MTDDDPRIDHQQWDELAAGYALHALAPEEETLFTDHLVDCPRCQSSVDEHALTAAQLGAIAHSQEVSAPPSWATIRDAIIPSPDTPDLEPVVEPDRPAPVADLSARRRRYDLSRRTLAAAASVAVLAAGGVVAWRVTGGGSTPVQVGACHQTAGCHVVALRSTRGGGAASGQAVVASDGSVTVMPTGFSQARKGSTYVLWQVPRDGRPRAIGEFDSVGANRTAHGRLSVSYSDLLELAVSSERSGAIPNEPSQLVAVGVTA